MFVSQEGRTALIWAAMNGYTDVVEALIENGAYVNAKEKVRRRCRVITGVGGNDQRMFGS
jgi:ankyrin repeat protein